VFSFVRPNNAHANAEGDEDTRIWENFTVLAALKDVRHMLVLYIGSPRICTEGAGGTEGWALFPEDREGRATCAVRRWRQ
jgi:hypothetical protein